MVNMRTFGSPGMLGEEERRGAALFLGWSAYFWAPSLSINGRCGVFRGTRCRPAVPGWTRVVRIICAQLLVQ